MARIAADVGYEHMFLLALEECRTVIHAAHHAAVHIAVNATQRFECGDGVRRLQRPEVSGVPYLIHILKKMFQHVVEGAVRVRNDTYAFHKS